MKNLIEQAISRRFGGYVHILNNVREDLPLRRDDQATGSRRPAGQSPGGQLNVVVIGGGIAGLSAAALLAERGFPVTLLEKNSYIGGKAGSWDEVLPDGFRARVDHGFHGFFRQYHNLLGLMRRTGAAQRLVPIDDYLIIGRDGRRYSFKDVRTTPLLNMLSLRRTGVYRLGELMSHRESQLLLELLRYDREETFRRFDAMSFQEYADAARLPDAMRLMFTTFSRSFFADPDLMSMAELIRSFHFYFLSNDRGLLYDYLDGDFETTFLAPVRRYLESLGVRILTSRPVARVARSAAGFSVGGDTYGAVVLAADAGAARRIAEASPFLRDEDPRGFANLTSLRQSQGYAVLRAWLDRPVTQAVPPFIAVDRRELLDSITLNHRIDPASAAWARQHDGSVVELHSYALPRGLDDRGRIAALMVEEAGTFLPELAGAKVMHTSLHVGDDFTAFHTGLHASRPGVAEPGGRPLPRRRLGGHGRAGHADGSGLHLRIHGCQCHPLPRGTAGGADPLGAAAGHLRPARRSQGSVNLSTAKNPSWIAVETDASRADGWSRRAGPKNAAAGKARVAEMRNHAA